MNTPISEAGFAGAAVGAAICRAAADRRDPDLRLRHACMMDMIVNQAAKLRYMLGGTADGAAGDPRAAGRRHPPGRAALAEPRSLVRARARPVVVAPSTPYDAKGLLIAAIRDDNPVMFLEHKLLYLGQTAPVPEEPYAIPIGKAAIKRAGTDVTIVATQVMVERALSAADASGARGHQRRGDRPAHAASARHGLLRAQREEDASLRHCP